MTIAALTKEIEALSLAIEKNQKFSENTLAKVHQDLILSAKNLVHYLLLRSKDLRYLQDELSELGLSSLRTGEGYVLSNLKTVSRILYQLANVQDNYEISTGVGFQASRALLIKNTNKLFGGSLEVYKTRIMVTMPKEAAKDYQIIVKMALKGMEVARINLGKDDKSTWKAIVKNIKKAEKITGQSITIYMDLAGPKIRSVFYNKKGEAISTKKSIPVQVGERLVLSKKKVPTKKSVFGNSGQQKIAAIIGVTLPQVIDDVQIGEAILFDDGMIHAKVIKKNKDAVTLEIQQCFKPKLGNQKGINLPTTKLKLPALTPYDLAVLPFACKHAHIIGYSFVKNSEDVALLYSKLKALHANELGVVFKIENQEAFDNFPDILLAGMQRKAIGVMIARGDLAVEIGFERISEVQKELLWLCEAAHIPVIWATQVLETLAKKGIPTRAEISDAAQGARAECVMLNKGPHIVEAIQVLRNILNKMDAHVSKKKDSLRALRIAKDFVERSLV